MVGTDRGLRPHRRPADRGPRRPRRLDRLALPAAVRLPRLLRRAARRRPGRPLAARARPTAGGCTRRRYRGDTLVLETEWETADGTVRVVDLMPPRGEAPDVVRIVEGVVRPGADAHGAAAPLRLRPRRPVGPARSTASWRRSPARTPSGCGTPVAGRPRRPGASTPSSRWRPATGCRSCSPTRPRTAAAAAGGRRATRWTRHRGFWTDWIGPLPLRRPLGRRRPPVAGDAQGADLRPDRRHRRRGHDVAARAARRRRATGTTATAGCGTPPSPCRPCSAPATSREARAWRDWLLRAVAGDPADLQIMYALDGSRRIPEYELPWLSGYEGSAPVRVGNAAAGAVPARRLGRGPRRPAPGPRGRAVQHRRRLGPAAGPAGLPRGRLGPSRTTACGRSAARSGTFVHSKVMAWAGLDRAVQAVERFGLDGPVDRWRRLRQEIHDDVCAQGLRRRPEHLHPVLRLAGPGRRAAADPPRRLPAAGTTRAWAAPWTPSQRELDQDGFLLRYRPDADGGVDGLPGGEGAFLACTFWLADALRRTAAAPTRPSGSSSGCWACATTSACSARSTTPRAGRQVGNTPQAFSHVGLVNTARHLSGDAGPRATGGPARRRRTPA